VRRSRETLAALAALLLLAGPGPATAQDPAEPGPSTAGGRLMWISSDDLDLLGDLWVDLPFHSGARGSVVLGLDARTTIEQTVSELTFSLRDLLYDIEVAWRGTRRRPG
jgi:hypothetical protein